jgi:hypothetical protein
VTTSSGDVGGFHDAIGIADVLAAIAAEGCHQVVIEDDGLVHPWRDG